MHVFIWSIKKDRNFKTYTFYLQYDQNVTTIDFKHVDVHFFNNMCTFNEIGVVVYFKKIGFIF
jgi:hypothetical protein